MTFTFHATSQNYSLNIDVRFLRTLKFKLLKPLPFMKIIHHLFAICFDTHFLVKSWWVLCYHIVIFDHQLDDWLGKLFFKQRNFKSMNVMNVYKKEYVPRGTIIYVKWITPMGEDWNYLFVKVTPLIALRWILNKTTFHNTHLPPYFIYRLQILFGNI